MVQKIRKTEQGLVENEKRQFFDFFPLLVV